MPDFLLHLWSGPPLNISLECPAPPPGTPNPDLTGFFAVDGVRAAYTLVGYVSLALVVLGVLICYLWTRSTLGPGFVRRWWFFQLGTGLACALAALLLFVMPTSADAASCEQYMLAFPATLPGSLVFNRAIAGIFWGMGMFLLVSLLMTQVAGRAAWSKGFFHNRGCPWPRFNPLAE